MKEFSCRFGDSERLVGIITAPDPPARRAAIVLVTAGVSPKSGPFRLYAELARRMARDGFWALRFDLGGIGDSRPAGTAEPLSARTSCEIGRDSQFVESGLLFRSASRKARLLGSRSPISQRHQGGGVMTPKTSRAKPARLVIKGTHRACLRNSLPRRPLWNALARACPPR